MILTTDELDWGANPYKPVVLETTAERLVLFDDLADKLQANLAKADWDDLAKEWTMRQGDQVLMKSPKGVLIRSAGMSHMTHHRAQLGVYFTARSCHCRALRAVSGRVDVTTNDYMTRHHGTAKMPSETQYTSSPVWSTTNPPITSSPYSSKNVRRCRASPLLGRAVAFTSMARSRPFHSITKSTSAPVSVRQYTGTLAGPAASRAKRVGR